VHEQFGIGREPPVWCMVAIAIIASLQNSGLVYCTSSTVYFLRNHVSLSSITSPKCSNINIIWRNFNSNSISRKLCLNRLPVGQCVGVEPVQCTRSTADFLRQETPYFIHWICGRQSVRTLTQLSTRLGAACRSIQEASTWHGPEAATHGSQGWQLTDRR